MMIDPRDVWIELHPSVPNMGRALLDEEEDVVLALDWRGADDLKTVWVWTPSGNVQPLLWPMNTNLPVQGNVMHEGQLLAYSIREH